MFPFSALCALFLVFLEKAMVPWPLVGRGCWVSGRRGAVGFPTEGRLKCSSLLRLSKANLQKEPLNF